MGEPFDPNNHPGGRPRIEIDWNIFDKLCYLQCTQKEICLMFDCSVDVIEDRCHAEKGMSFAEYRAKKSVHGVISVRRQKFRLAEEGNPFMIARLDSQYVEKYEREEEEQKMKKVIESDPESDIDRLAKEAAMWTTRALPPPNEST